jgi:hypothetical protein
MLLTLLLFAYSIRITLPMTLFLSVTTTNTNAILAKKQIVASMFQVNIDKDEYLDEMESKAVAIFKNMEQAQRAACLRNDDRNKLSLDLKRDILQILKPELKCATWNGKKFNEAIGIWVGAEPA